VLVCGFYKEHCRNIVETCPAGSYISHMLPPNYYQLCTVQGIPNLTNRKCNYGMGVSNPHVELEWGDLGGSPARHVDDEAEDTAARELVGESRVRPVGWELGSGQRPRGVTNRRRERGPRGRRMSFRRLEEGCAASGRRSSGGGADMGGGWVRTLAQGCRMIRALFCSVG
jgi:hypothetical protein